jgi:glycosyltransferase involved in cell wall biosynthesis
MGKRVIICVTNDLCTDQRVQKISLSLHKNGFEVLLVGRKLKKSLPFNPPYQFKRLKLIFIKKVFFYAEINIRFFLLLLFSKADIFLANDTDTLLAVYLAATIRRKQFVFDAHELFPESPEIANRAFVKKSWTRIENFILPKAKYSYTVCQSIADYYHKKYGTPMQVVRNVPYHKNLDEIEPLTIFGDKKLLLYQGAVNIGRGLEWVIDCMPLLDNCVLAIIGSGDILDELKERVAQLQLENKVVFLGKMTPKELIHYTKSADIGLCLLENIGLSYYYSLPNRIFDFIQAGVPLLATNFPEIANIVGKYHTGVLIDHYEPAYLSEVIKQMIATGKNEYRENLKKLSQDFCWEKEEKQLLSVFNQLK